MKLKEYTGEIGGQYNIDSYDNSGFYDYQGIVMYVSKKSFTVLSLDNLVEFQLIVGDQPKEEKAVEEIKEPMVSENLLLKALAITVSKEKYKDVNK